MGGPIKDEVDVYRVKKAFRNVAIRQAEARAASEARKQNPAEDCITDADGGFGL